MTIASPSLAPGTTTDWMSELSNLSSESPRSVKSFQQSNDGHQVWSQDRLCSWKVVVGRRTSAADTRPQIFVLIVNASHILRSHVMAACFVRCSSCGHACGWKESIWWCEGVVSHHESEPLSSSSMVLAVFSSRRHLRVALAGAVLGHYDHWHESWAVLASWNGNSQARTSRLLNL